MSGLKIWLFATVGFAWLIAALPAAGNAAEHQVVARIAGASEQALTLGRDLDGDGDPNDDGGWTVRLYHKPFLPWIWIGALLMMLGGLISLTDRRFRVGAPARRRRARAGPASEAAVQPAE